MHFPDNHADVTDEPRVAVLLAPHADGDLDTLLRILIGIAERLVHYPATPQDQAA